MKLPKFLWNATYQAMVQKRDEAQRLADLWHTVADSHLERANTLQLQRDTEKTLVEYWQARAKEMEGIASEHIAISVDAKAELATHVAANLARLAKAPKRDEHGRFAAAAPKAAEMRGRV